MKADLSMLENPSPAEPDARASAPASRKLFPNLRRPLPLTLLLTLLCALALQLWRPYYHLSDDNLTATYPISSEIVHRIADGRPATTIGSIFGGEYPWTRDVAAVTNLCGPYQLLCSWMLLTPAEFIYVDAVSTLILMTIAGAFTWSALALRRQLKLEIADGWIVFLSLSYTFTPFNLLVGSSWIGFLNAQAAAPLILVAMLNPNWRRGIPLITGALLFSVFGGHLHSACFLGLFMGLLALGLSWTEKSLRPPLVLACGALGAFLIALPLLLPAMQGFASSDRNNAWPVAYTKALCLTPTSLITSFASGPLSAFGAPMPYLHETDPDYLPLIAFATSNLLFLALFFTKRRWSRLDLVLVLGVVIAGIFIVRPMWLAVPMASAPLFRSLRWPFREISLLLFFSHMVLLLNLPLLSRRTVRIALGLGAVFFATTFFHRPPTFNPMRLDRALITEKVAQNFWAKYIQERGQAPMIVSSIATDPMTKTLARVPFSLLGVYDYPCILGLTNVSGYSPTIPATPFNLKVHPWHHSGFYMWQHAEQIRAENPGVVHVSLRNIRPCIFVIRDGPSVRAFLLDIDRLEVRELPKPPPTPAATPAPENKNSEQNLPK